MSKTLRKAMLSSVAMLLVGVLSLTGVTYAWFTSATSSEVKGIQLSVDSADGGIQVSDKLTGAYASTLELKTDKYARPVSTVGGADDAWTFYTGLISSGDDSKITTALATDVMETPAEGGEAVNVGPGYLKQSLFLKNEGETLTVDLGSTTVADSVATKNGVRAARVGIRYVKTYNVHSATEVGTNDPKGSVGTNNYAIYEPNAKDHFDVSTNGNVLPYYGVQGASTEPVTYKNLDEEAEDFNDDVFAKVTTETENPANIEITVPGQSIVEIEVYVWVEGQDVDCINAVGSSKLDTLLTFNKVVKVVEE